MKEKSFDSINVVPFIDIMLVLLTIVLATATFIQTGAIPVKLPEVSSQEQLIEGVTITISKDGTFYINNNTVTLDNLKDELIKHDAKTTQITVWADKEASIQPLASLMSILKEKGFEKVNLQVEVKE